MIIQHAQLHEPEMPIRVIGPIMVRMAQEADVPVCVMLDHGEDLDYVKKALDLGFSAVMFDGSSRPYEENVRPDEGDSPSGQGVRRQRGGGDRRGDRT